MLTLRKFAYVFLVFAAMSAAGAFAADRLPAGYTEVEYIYGTNDTARFVTDYVPTPNADKIEAVIEFAAGTLGSNDHTIWCARETDTKRTWTLFVFNRTGGNKFRFDYGTTKSSDLTPVVVAGTKYTVTAEGNVFTCSGGQGVTIDKVADFPAGGPVTLFASYVTDTDTSKDKYGKQRLYSFKVWRSGELIHYFVPCKDPGGFATMVDICDNPAALTKNGQFAAGPEGHYYDDTLFCNLSILPIPTQYVISGSHPEPGFTVTNYNTGASWIFAEGGAVSSPTPFEISYSFDAGVGTVTATGKAGGEYEGETLTRSYVITDDFLVNGGFESGYLAPGWTGTARVIDASDGHKPNDTTTFITGTYCGMLKKTTLNVAEQVFTNEFSCCATLSWKCKHRCDWNVDVPVYYTVMLDGEVLYPEEMVTGSNVLYRSVENLILTAGEHTLRFQGRTDGEDDSSLFLDDVSVRAVSRCLICPIPDQILDYGGLCRPEFVVTNVLSGGSFVVGGDIVSPYFDVEYTNNDAPGTATVTVTGKGDFAGEILTRTFVIITTKFEDENISVPDVSVQRLDVGGKSVYVFTNAASVQVVTAKRDIYLTDCLLVGGGGAGGGKAGGGGGAGGVTNATNLAGVLVKKNGIAAVTVGAGGVHSGNPQHKGGNGGATSVEFGTFASSVAGGGGGGSWNNASAAAGGSGGGAAQNGTGGAGIAGIGFDGATGLGTNTAKTGGGGGAGHAGYQTDVTESHAGYGGEGVSNNITGVWVVYGGGGGGGGGKGVGDSTTITPGLGGIGGGGDGGSSTNNGNGNPGTDGLGGGGGGGYMTGKANSDRGGQGGAGTVILVIKPADFDIEPIADQYLDVGAIECVPNPVVRTNDGVTLLKKGVDYTVSYTGNTQSGNAYLTVTGINDYAGKVSEISFKIYLRYFVDDDAASGGDGSEALPFATISSAIENAKTAIAAGAQFVEIRVAVGTYGETDFALDGPIAIVGVDRNNVIVNDATTGKRAFNLSHTDARVSNLTISGSGYSSDGGCGGHVYMTAGAIVDCVVSGGSVGRNASQGGNVWMSGGKLVRCQILNGRLSQSLAGGNTGFGAGVYASGGVVDSCLVKGNTCYNKTAGAGITVAGTAKIVNCTISGNAPSTYSSIYNYSAGICVDSANATVANCVIYGNGDNSATANFGTANPGRFFYCGSAVTNDSCATWTVLTDDDFAEFAVGNLRPIVGSKLVDFGTTGEIYLPVDRSSLDLDGNARVAGPAIDIGCYELDQSAFAYAGFASSYAVLEGSNVTFNASAVGPASDVVFRWDYGNGTVENTRDAAHVYAYPNAGLFTVRLSASPDGGTSWGEWYTVPTLVVVAPEVMYVDSNCATPTFPFKTKATASTTLTAALAALTNNVSGNVMCIDDVEVRILAGSSLTETDMRLARAVSVVGDSGNPGDVTIVDSVSGKRAFLITHPQARVANLTISGTGYGTSASLDGGQGGHISLSAGTVENCIIRGGGVNRSAKGGNIYMTGGRLVRCQILEGTLAKNYPGSPDSFGAGVYASGGVVDSCLMKNNICYNKSTGAGICAEGTVKVINCTLVGNTASTYNSTFNHSAGIYVNSANAMVVNSVIYGNSDNSALANFGTSNLNRFFYCGSSVTNASCATWTVLTDADFVDYAGGNLHQKRDSQLVDHGTTDTTYRPADCSTLDLDGNPRVLNKSVDLGCWEILVTSGLQIIVR